MSTHNPACRRCHIRKIKCDSNRPSCQHCIDAQVLCQPHVRQRRLTIEKNGFDARQRLKWLEDEISRHFNIDVKTIRNGADLGGHFMTSRPPLQQSNLISPRDTDTIDLDNNYDQNVTAQSRARLISNDLEEISMDVAPDISLLTLNATGETRYLGPSSGSFFAKYASNFARSFVSGTTGGGPLSILESLPAKEYLFMPAPGSETSNSPILCPLICKYLLNCYFKWVQPLFPLLNLSFRQLILRPLCFSHREQADHASSMDDNRKIHFVICQLVLALGAVHATEVDQSSDEYLGYLKYQEMTSNKRLSPNSIFMDALELLDSVAPMIKPSIHMIQILLLICIYGGYKPSGNRQWQLAGIAIRTSVEIGLHRQRDNWRFNTDDLDLRRRVFWTAYAIEITAAYNLGRPPSIPDEHIDALFPEDLPDIAMALHHIRHRQIQSRLLSQVYCAPGRLQALSEDGKKQILLKLQEELDHWRHSLFEIFQRSSTAYPVEYWERLYYSTTVALHRPTPLFPKPLVESVCKCLQSAGRFIDIHHSLLKSTSVPQSWMLLQGMLLQGITILVTTRVNTPLLLKRNDFSIPDIMEWSRKCSVVLTILSERWSDKSISNLETRFSLLANDTLQMVLALKDRSYQGRQKQDRPEHDGKLTAGLRTIPEANISQSCRPIDWGYLDPFNDRYQEMADMSQSEPGPGFSTTNMASQGDTIAGALNDPLSLDSFFQGDELFNFWEPFSIDYEPTS